MASGLGQQTWWERKGFAEEPRMVVAAGGELLYRAGGGPTSLALGSFFTPLKAAGVLAAEAALNIVDWGNRCYYLATYRVRAGTVMWVGRVAHGAADVADRAGVQVFVEHPLGRVELVGDVEALKQDVFVAPRAGHA